MLSFQYPIWRIGIVQAADRIALSERPIFTKTPDSRLVRTRPPFLLERPSGNWQRILAVALQDRRSFDTVATMLQKIFNTTLLIAASVFPSISPLALSFVVASPGWTMLETPRSVKGREQADEGPGTCPWSLWVSHIQMRLITVIAVTKRPS